MKNILIIEDDLRIRRILQLELEHGWLEWSLFRCILSWLWSEKGGCCLTVTALSEKGSKYVNA